MTSDEDEAHQNAFLPGATCSLILHFAVKLSATGYEASPRVHAPGVRDDQYANISASQQRRQKDRSAGKRDGAIGVGASYVPSTCYGCVYRITLLEALQYSHEGCMRSITSSSSESKSFASSLYRWMLRSAVAGTIGTTLGLILGGLLAALFLFDQPTSRAHVYLYSEDRVFRNMLLACALSGSPLGLAIGISIAYAWKRFIVAAGQHVETWMFFTITSTWIGVTCTFIGLGISDWYGAGLPLIILIVGMFSGILIGLPQSFILWSSGRERLAWVISHSSAVIIGTILIVISGARDLIILVVLLGLIWAAYGGVMGLIFNKLRYSM